MNNLHTISLVLLFLSMVISLKAQMTVEYLRNDKYVTQYHDGYDNITYYMSRHGGYSDPVEIGKYVNGKYIPIFESIDIDYVHYSSNGYIYFYNYNYLSIHDNEGNFLKKIERKDFKNAGIGFIKSVRSSAESLFIYTKKLKLYEIPFSNKYDVLVERKKEIPCNKMEVHYRIDVDKSGNIYGISYKEGVKDRKIGSRRKQLYINNISKNGDVTHLTYFTTRSRYPHNVDLTFLESGAYMIIPNYNNFEKKIIYMNLSNPDKVYKSNIIYGSSVSKSCASVNQNEIICPYSKGYGDYGIVKCSLIDNLNIEETKKKILSSIDAGQYESAITYSDYAIKNNPECKECYYFRVLSKIEEIGSVSSRFEGDRQNEKIKSVYVSNSPDNIFSLFSYALLRDAGVNSQSNETMTDCIKDLEIALSSDHGYTNDVVRLLGYINYYEGNVNQATSYLEQIVGSVNNPKVYELLVSIYQRKGNLSDAKRTLDKANDLFPNNLAIQFLNGNMSYLDRNYIEAVNHYKSIQDRDLKGILSHNTAMAYMKLRNQKGVCDSFANACNHGLCDSRNYLYQNCGWSAIREECGDCGGTGQIRPGYLYQTCGLCNGHGYYETVPKPIKLELKYLN